MNYENGTHVVGVCFNPFKKRVWFRTTTSS